MSIAKAQQVSHIRFQVPDLSRIAAFLRDFGMEVVEQSAGRALARGTGAAPFLYEAQLGDPASFVAAGYRFDSVSDLEKLAEHDGLAIEALDAPGGGYVVKMSDPDGFIIEAVAGQELRRPEGPAADGSTKPKPSFVQQMSHAVFAVSDISLSQQWYAERLGVVASDEIFNDEGIKIAAFLRLDRGDVPSDHHALFIFNRPTGPGFVHAAFDVPDADDLIRGHEHLLEAGHGHHWGIGRHQLGNQIFDYWNDPWGHELEHCTGGDKHAVDVPAGSAGIKEMLDVKWGDINPRLR